MPRWAATLLGLLTALPIGYVGVFVAHVLSIQPGVQPPPFPLAETVDWHLAAMALSCVLLMIYLIATFTLRQVPKSKRMFWAIAHLLFGSFIAFPVFWYLYIWRRGQPNDSQPL
jgi:hypothetical protein